MQIRGLQTTTNYLMTPLLVLLKSEREVDCSRWAPNISFVVIGKTSKEIAESFDVKSFIYLIALTQ